MSFHFIHKNPDHIVAAYEMRKQREKAEREKAEREKAERRREVAAGAPVADGPEGKTK